MNNEYFETIKCDDYEIFNLSYHEKRVSNSIGMNLNLQEYIYPPTSNTLRCKLIYNQEGVIDVQYYKYKKREIKIFKLVYDDEIEYSKKYLDRGSLDSVFNKRGQSDEIIIIKNGFVTDTSIANIAIYNGNNWISPKTPLLKGTTRARYLEKKEIYEENITVDILKSAKKIALMNAMIDFDIIEYYSFF